MNAAANISPSSISLPLADPRTSEIRMSAQVALDEGLALSFPKSKPSTEDCRAAPILTSRNAGGASFAVSIEVPAATQNTGAEQGRSFGDHTGSRETPRQTVAGETKTVLNTLLNSAASPLEGAVQLGPPAPEVGGRNAEQSEAPRAAPMPNVPQLPQATTASQIAIRLDSNGEAGQVELRIRERAGEVQIAVRSTDQGVATTLRQDLGDLMKRLDSHASTNEGARLDANPAEPALQQFRQVPPGSDSARGYSFFSDDSQQRQRQQQQAQREQNVQPDPSSDGLEELRIIMTDLSKGVFLK